MRHSRKINKTRKHRRTRRRGGVDTIFICHSNLNSDEKCINDYAQSVGLTFHNVPPDGDCFFHTLLLYYSLNGIAPPVSQNPNKTQMIISLRKIIVAYINNNWADYEHIINKSEVNKLQMSKEWSGPAGDLVAAAAARAFGVVINIYDVHPPIAARAAVPAKYNATGKRIRTEVVGQPAIGKHIIRHIFEPTVGAPLRGTINMARISDNHFGLLEPNAAAAAAAAPVAAAPHAAPAPAVKSKKPAVAGISLAPRYKKPTAAAAASPPPAAAPAPVPLPPPGLGLLRRKPLVAPPPLAAASPPSQPPAAASPPKKPNMSEIIKKFRNMGLKIPKKPNENTLRALFESMHIYNSNSSSSSNNGNESPTTQAVRRHQQELLNKIKKEAKKP